MVYYPCRLMKAAALKNLLKSNKKDLTECLENDIIIFVERIISSAGRAPDS